VVDHLKIDHPDAEPAHDLHVTLSYLGKTEEYSLRQLADLPEILDAWAEGHKPLKAAIQGAGTFLAADEESPHVLHALVNAPGLHRVQSHLVDHLKRYGYKPREEHGYLPHVTLGYTKHPVRFLPQVKRMEWTARSVWSAIGGRRQPHRLKG
jgi:2'-5' RNA ligase